MPHGHHFGAVFFTAIAAPPPSLASAEDPSENSDLIQTARLIPFVVLFEDSVNFGRAVAMDGDLMVVGAREEDALGLNSGAAYVFCRADGDWYLQAKLLPSDPEAHDEFGWSVAIDGATVLELEDLANGISTLEAIAVAELHGRPQLEDRPGLGLRRSRTDPEER